METDKMIIAILQGEDYGDVVDILNNHGFYVTVLNSSGGFMKKKSVTIMIGVSEDKLSEALSLLKKYGGVHKEQTYQATNSGVMVPINMQMGGLVYFVLDVLECGRC